MERIDSMGKYEKVWSSIDITRDTHERRTCNSRDNTTVDTKHHEKKRRKNERGHYDFLTRTRTISTVCVL